MRKLLALAAALPLVAFAQEGVPAPAPAAHPPPGQGHAPVQQQPYATTEKVRDSWYIGFGLGSGSGSAAGQGDRYSFEDLSVDTPTTGFFNFRVGATLTPRLLLGGELSAIAATASASGAESSTSIGTLNLVATYFPMGRGFSVRGGVGRAAFSNEWDGTGLYDGTYELSGLNLMAGVGYAWWLGRTFNLSVNFDLAQQYYGDSDVDLETSRFGVLYLGLDWY